MPTALTHVPTSSTLTLTLGIIGVIVSLPAWIIFLHGAGQLLHLYTSGQPTTTRTRHLLRRTLTLLTKTLFHTELRRKPAIALAHWFVMFGFLLGVLVWFEAYVQTFWPAGGWPLLRNLTAYHFLEEILACGTILGILFLIGVRLHAGTTQRQSRFYGSNTHAARFVEAIVFLEALGMLGVKAAKIAAYGGASPTHPASAWADFLSLPLSSLLPASATLVSALALFKLLTGMIWLIVVGKQRTWGVSWHRILAFFTLFTGRNPDGTDSLGALNPLLIDGTPVTLDNVATLTEKTRTPDAPPLGIGTRADLSWKALLDATTCTECGRCQSVCPAWNTGKPLSPKLLMMNLRDLAVDTNTADTPIIGTALDEDALWSCTMCGACVHQCPVDIEHLDYITDLRRFQVLSEAHFPTELTSLFTQLERHGNPWGRPARERHDWISAARRDGLTVPIFGEDVTDFSTIEYLFWVGCAGTFDDRGIRTTRAIIELLTIAGVKFAILAERETCTGDPARRAGNEFLFQMLATENVATLTTVFDGIPKGRRKIVTTCAHCFNTLRNEYPDFDGHFDVFHHTQLLHRLVREGRLTPIPRTPENRRPITYHDPCFLGRHNRVYDPPRELIEATGATLREMPRTRERALCCGAGGARMFMEEKLGTRINDARAAEAAATGATTIAVGCPFCNTMLSNGTASLTMERPTERPEVVDVATLLLDAISSPDGTRPQPHAPAFLDTPPRTSTASSSYSAPDVPEPAPDASVPAPAIPQPHPQNPQKKPAPQHSAVPIPGQATARPATRTGAPIPGGAAPTTPTPTPRTPGAPTPPLAPPGTARPGAPIPRPGSAPKVAPGAAQTPRPPRPQNGTPPPRPGSARPSSSSKDH